MPRIKRQHSSGPNNKLKACLELLLSGTPGECLAGELGCCADDCCSSSAVSRALAEYCQHSSAARDAFTAAKGLEAMQVALTRGRPAAAAAAARVLGALCATPHGLRSVLAWQRSSGSDLLSLLGGAAGCGGLPPALRAEAVDALRGALGALHGPAAGGGMELEAALRAPSALQPDGACAAPATAVTSPSRSGAAAAAGAAPAPPAATVLGSVACDLLSHVALPPLLSPNLHLRAAAARLIALAAAEGLLPGGPTAAAATLTAALVMRPPPPSPRQLPAAAAEAEAEAGRCQPLRSDPDTHVVTHGSVRVLPLCELVAALLEQGGKQCAALLQALRGPQTVMALCSAAFGPPGACHDEACGLGAAEREALLDCVLGCLRAGPDKLWIAPYDTSSQWGNRAFAAGAASLAHAMLGAAAGTDAGVGAGPRHHQHGQWATDPAARAPCGTAAELASTLAAWPQAILHHEDVRPAATALLDLLCRLALELLADLLPHPHPHPHVCSAEVQARATPGKGLHPELQQHLYPRTEDLAVKADGIGNRVVAGACDWLRPTACASSGSGSRARGDAASEELGSVGGWEAWPDAGIAAWPAAEPRCGTMAAPMSAGSQHQQHAALRLLGSAAAAGVRLYAACGAPGGAAAVPPGCGDGSMSSCGVQGGGQPLAPLLLECLEQLLEAAGRLVQHDASGAALLLAGTLQALTDTGTLAAVMEGAEAARGPRGRSALLRSLAGVVAGLVAGLLSPSARGEGDAAAFHARDVWDTYPRCLAEPGGGKVMGPAELGPEERAALLSALRLWSQLMRTERGCVCEAGAVARGERCTGSGEGAGERGQPTASRAGGCEACVACAVRPSAALQALAAAAVRALTEAGVSGWEREDVGVASASVEGPSCPDAVTGLRAGPAGRVVSHEGASLMMQACGSGSTENGLAAVRGGAVPGSCPPLAAVPRLGTCSELLAAVAAALTAAGGGAMYDSHGGGGGVADAWRGVWEIGKRLHQLLQDRETAPESVERPAVRDAKGWREGTSLVRAEEGWKEEGDDDLADAEAILDECLACVGVRTLAG